MANWKETSVTAWAGMDLLLGSPKAGNVMSDTLVSVGNIKEVSIETEDGEKKEWKDINGVIVDSFQQEATIKITTTIKNLNLSNLKKFWNVEEDTANGSIKVKGTSTSQKYSVQLKSSVQNAETFSAPYCSVTAKPKYGNDTGFELEVEITILEPAKGRELFVIGQTA